MSAAFSSFGWRKRLSLAGSLLPWILLMAAFVPHLNAEGVALRWEKLPPIPDALGLAGSFAGASGSALILAGGANFPDQPPWAGGAKTWHDRLFVLERPEGPWRSGFRLPAPLAYGVSLSSREGVVCIGGSDSRRHHSDVFILRWDGRDIRSEKLSPLPVPLANGCGAILGREIYVAGGTDSLDATSALHIFLRLNLDHPEQGWQALAPWPGRPRMLATAGVANRAFFLAGGADLRRAADGKPARTYLRDVYRYTPAEGWRRAADMPHPVVGAPNPAPALDDHSFLLVGGDDGTLAGFEPPEKHPGFPRRVLRYEAHTDRWSVEPDAPFARATLPAVQWRGMHVLLSGELRPGVRSPEVWALLSNPAD